jgi:error-prone DNA polymerase
MGFYHPATLVKDGQRHGVDFHPVDVNHSGWRCRWQNGGVRIGLRYVHGLRREAGEKIEAEQARRPFRDVADLQQRATLSSDHLERLAHVGALASLGLGRRAALWQVAEVAGRRGPLLADLPPETTSPLAEMSPQEEAVADYSGLHLTTGPHLVTWLRPQLDRLGAMAMDRLGGLADGAPVRVGGAIIVRQRPGTAKGFVFLTLEDETGTVQAIVRPDLFRDQRTTITGSPLVLVEGTLQSQDGTLSVRAQRFTPLRADAAITSHDFH